MTLRFSTGARDAQASTLGLQGAFNAGYMKIFTGSQPTNADAAETGTLLGTITKASGALTKETRAVGTIVITGATSGTINSITVGSVNIIPDGAVSAVAGDTAATASALCDAINRNGIYTATVSSSTVTINPRAGAGAAHNALTLAGSLTTVTATYGTNTVAGGVAPANGLILLPPAAGIISKNTDVWSMVGIAAGTAGWFRLYGSNTNDAGALVSGAPYYPRIDGTCGVGSGDAQLSSLAVSVGSPHTVDVFRFTMQGA